MTQPVRYLWSRGDGSGVAELKIGEALIFDVKQLKESLTEQAREMGVRDADQMHLIARKGELHLSKKSYSHAVILTYRDNSGSSSDTDSSPDPDSRSSPDS